MARTLMAAFVLVVLLTLACAPRQTREVTTAEVVPLYEKEEAEAVPMQPAQPIQTVPVVPAQEVTGKTPGFRVQIFASETNDGAERMASQARFRVTEGVYVEYIYPYYKVRVGDCASREAADGLKARLVSMGYRDAFVVPTQINIR